MKKTGREKHLQDKLTISRQENNKLVNMMNNLECEIFDLKEENIRLRERLQLSPQGDDKIDELEQYINNLNFKYRRNNNENTI